MTEYRDAARIIRGLKERVDNLEEESQSGTGAADVYRQLAEFGMATDDMSATVGDTAFHWDADSWNFTEWTHDADTWTWETSTWGDDYWQ